MSLHSLVKSLFYRAGFSIKKLRGPSRKSGVSGGVNTIAPENLLRRLHQCDPYEGFDFQRYPFDPSGWGSNSPVFKRLLEEERPRLVVEVGTWKGGSALHMAGILDTLELPTPIICIDTWLGALEFWDYHSKPERHESLKLVNGFPSVYFEFLANVCHAGQQKRIIPFPQTASCGALWMRMNGIFADFIYLDASHEEEDVYLDIQNYWELLSDGGILLGDDWTWDGVQLAAKRFAKEQQLTINNFEEKWYIHKKG